MEETQKAPWAPQIYTPHGFVKEDILRGAKALDVGCGGRKLPGAIGMDIVALPGVDIVHSFNEVPWPFADNTFDLIFLNHALEHVGDVVQTMNELHRIGKRGCKVVVQVPYFRCVDAFNDPTHTHFFASHTLDYFIQGSGLAKYSYTDRLFHHIGFWYGWPHDSKNPLKQAFKKFILNHKELYDQYLSLLVPTECLTWELEVIKA